LNVATPFRLRLARNFCRALPPIIAQRVRSLIYPLRHAYRDNFEFRIPSQTGSIFQGRTSDFHGYPFSVHGYYEWRSWAIALALCSPGDTIIEIGANIGTETIGFRDIVGAAGKVFAFEPLPSNFEALQETLRLNKCEIVTALSFALGRDAGTVRFVVPDKKGASGIGHVASAGDSILTDAIEVNCQKLDALADQVGTARIIFIDTEGAETSVIDGARHYISLHQPALVMEASAQLLARAGSSLEELHEKVKKFNYEVFIVSRFGLIPVGNVQQLIVARGPANWLCLPTDQVKKISRIRRFLVACGLLPCIPGLNPLSKLRS
jgi:FkbM family methyltransferase